MTTSTNSGSKKRPVRDWPWWPLVIILAAFLAHAGVTGYLEREDRRQEGLDRDRVIRIEQRTNCLESPKCRKLLEKLRRRAATDKDISGFLEEVATREVGESIEEVGLPPTPGPNNPKGTPAPDKDPSPGKPNRVPPVDPINPPSPDPAPQPLPQPNPELIPDQKPDKDPAEDALREVPPTVGVETPILKVPCVEVGGTLHVNCE